MDQPLAKQGETHPSEPRADARRHPPTSLEQKGFSRPGARAFITHRATKRRCLLQFKHLPSRLSKTGLVPDQLGDQRTSLKDAEHDNPLVGASSQRSSTRCADEEVPIAMTTESLCLSSSCHVGVTACPEHCLSTAKSQGGSQKKRMVLACHCFAPKQPRNVLSSTAFWRLKGCSLRSTIAVLGPAAEDLEPLENRWQL